MRQYEATVRTLSPPGGKREGWPVLVAGAVAGIGGQNASVQDLWADRPC
jgi:hypothetical protein